MIWSEPSLVGFQSPCLRSYIGALWIRGFQLCLDILMFLPFSFFNFKKYFLFIFREKERACEQELGRGRERGRERIPSRLCTFSVEPDVGLNPRTVRLWPGLKSRVGRLTDWAMLAPLMFLSIVTVKCFLRDWHWPQCPVECELQEGRQLLFIPCNVLLPAMFS